MIIDKEQLISLLEEKTDLEREKVEDQLAQLVIRIQQAAEENKTFEIEGFGTFSMQDENLQFEPTHTLETEINNKYAGMKPIELIGAFKEPEGDEVPAIDENVTGINDKARTFDEESVSEDITGETGDPVAKTTSDEEEQKEGMAEELPAETEEKEYTGTSEDESRKKVLEEMISGMEDQPASPVNPADEPPSELKASRSDEAEDHPEKESDLVSKLLIAAVVIIAIGLSGWMAYDTGLIGGNEEPDNYAQAGPSVAQQSDQPQVTGEQDGSSPEPEANIISEPEQEMSVGTQEDLSPQEETEEAGFGLTGKINDNISSGYTIVVHSLRNLDEAESRKENLQEAGYRALISKANVQGTTYFRVGIGQFETVEDAQQAVSDIPESFQKDQGHFIKRIQ